MTVRADYTIHSDAPETPSRILVRESESHPGGELTNTDAACLPVGSELVLIVRVKEEWGFGPATGVARVTALPEDERIECSASVEMDADERAIRMSCSLETR